MRDWVLLVYKVPSRPTTLRVHVWRKLRRLGALLLHDAVWVLPDTPWTREQFQWLAAEIRELDGEAMVWVSRLAWPDEDVLVQRFRSQVDAAYQEILEALEGPEPDLAALSRRYQQVRAQDYLGSDLGLRVREALLRARGGSESCG